MRLPKLGVKERIVTGYQRSLDFLPLFFWIRGDCFFRFGSGSAFSLCEVKTFRLLTFFKRCTFLWIQIRNSTFREFYLVNGTFLANFCRAVVIFYKRKRTLFELAYIPFYMSMPYPDSFSFSAIRRKEKEQALCIFFIEQYLYIL